MPARETELRNDFLVGLGLVLLTTALFWRVQTYEFVVYDDLNYIVTNPDILSGFSWSGVKASFLNYYVNSWFPLAIISHMIDVELYDMNAGGHHSTSLLLHVITTVLLFVFLRRSTDLLWPSALVALLFAVHPLHVEPVAWVSARKDVLGTFFMMICLLFYLRYVRTRGRGVYVALIATMVLAFLSKTSLMPLPLLMLLLDFWPLKRISEFHWREMWPLVVEKIPMFFVAALTAAAAVYTAGRGGALVTLESSSLSSRLLNVPLAYGHYLMKTLWPANLSIIYPDPGSTEPQLWQVVAWSAVLLGVSLAALRTLRTHPYISVGWFWFVVSLLPLIGIMQHGDHIVSDRYTYVSLIGLFVAVVWTCSALREKAPGGRPIRVMAVSSIVIALAVCASLQLGHWRTSVTLFEHASAVTKDNHLAEMNLGVSLEGDGRPGDAIAHYLRAIEIEPDIASAHNNLGHALSLVGRDEEAALVLLEALELDPNYINAHFNRGVVLWNLAEYIQALQHFDRIIVLYPLHAQGHTMRAATLRELGRVDEARAAYAEALRIAPDYAPARDGERTLAAEDELRGL